MDSFEANKIIGAVLGTVFVLFGGSILAEGIFHSEAPEEPGYEIVAAETPAAGGAAAEAPAGQPLPVLLAAASAEEGATQFRKCTACHNNEKGAGAKVGPDLWDVVNRPVASMPDFAYSAPMQEFSQGGSVHWTFEELNAFLTDPQEHVPGTAMGFAGLKDDADRADLLVYLHTLSDNPAPLPEPTAAAPAEGAPAAEGTANPAATTAAQGQEQPQSAGTTDTETAVATPDAAPTMVPATGDAATAAPTAANDTGGAPTGGDTTAPAAEGTVAEGAAGQTTGTPAAPAAAAPAAPATATPDATAPAAPAPAAAPAGDAAAAPAAAGTEVAGLPASADPAAGKQVFRKCMACHTIEEGGANKIGPALHGVFGRPVASHEGYNYSPAMTAHSEGGTVVWDYPHLFSFLEDPQGVVPGTRMSFPGVKDETDRNNLIAYLKSMSGGAQ